MDAFELMDHFTNKTTMKQKHRKPFIAMLVLKRPQNTKKNTNPSHVLSWRFFLSRPLT